jgi:hypothetical protein
LALEGLALAKIGVPLKLLLLWSRRKGLGVEGGMLFAAFRCNVGELVDKGGVKPSEGEPEREEGFDLA